MFCNRRTRRSGFSGLAQAVCASAILVLIALCQPLVAQVPGGGTVAKPYPASPGLRPINHPSLPTGQLGALKTINGDVGPLQPVQWKLPEGVKVEVAQPGSFQTAPDGSNEFALQVGAVYRFKISGIATYPGQALYPTLEIIGRLYPPEGKEWDFPVEIEVPVRDLALALRGNFITRVIFVENSENPANVDASDSNENLTFDVPESVDPVVAANVHGRALAILRVGSREPDGEPSESDPFFFGLPRVDFRPAPGVAPAVSRTDELSPEPVANSSEFKLTEPDQEEVGQEDKN